MSRCRIFHDWGRWQEPEAGKLIVEGQATNTTVMSQCRACERCGLVEVRKVW